MDKKEMQQLITDRLSMKLGDGYQISIHPFQKTNITREGLLIIKEGENISPAIYLEPFYEALENGASAYAVTDRILQAYHSAQAPSGLSDTIPIRDFNRVRDRLFVKLINRHMNAELLEDVPHGYFLDDFAVTVHCLVDAAAYGTASFLVHNSHMEMWGTDTDTLLAFAGKNTRDLFGIDIQNMSEVLGELLDGQEDIFPVLDAAPSSLWVMTNRSRLMGASTVLFDDVLKKFASEHGDFYVIFSSVHELLLIPAQPGTDASLLSEINQEVNASQLQEEEILGTKAYFYSRERGFVL